MSAGTPFGYDCTNLDFLTISKSYQILSEPTKARNKPPAMHFGVRDGMRVFMGHKVLDHGTHERDGTRGVGWDTG